MQSWSVAMARRRTAASFPLAAFEQRANTTTSAADLVGTDHRADQYIGPLRDSLLVKNLVVRTLSGLVGNVSIPKAGTGLSAGWVPEGTALSESNMTFDAVTLTPHHVGGITEMSRQLIQQSAPAIEDLVRQDLSYAVAAAVDRSEEHTSELQSLMRNSYAVFSLT